MKQNVNFIEHYKSINFKMVEDNRLSPLHISLYNGLFLIWNECGFETELSINRNDVMKVSKIGSANTYIKLMKELHLFEYICYKPSFNPLKGSKVEMYIFDKGTDKGTVKGSSKGTDKGGDKGGDTLYKLLNSKTIKLLNNNFEIVNLNLEKWILNENKKEILIIPENLKSIWDLWIEYRKAKKIKNYAGEKFEQMAIDKLIKFSNSNPITAKQIIDESITNSWTGFFELKNLNNNQNGKHEFTRTRNR
jgi:hypothetical protein